MAWDDTGFLCRAFAVRNGRWLLACLCRSCEIARCSIIGFRDRCLRATPRSRFCAPRCIALIGLLGNDIRRPSRIGWMDELRIVVQRSIS